MTRWNKTGIPHKGWTCSFIEDLETPDHECEMCGQQNIRYVHEMSHPEYKGLLQVGCVCAGKMENNYKAAKERERRLKTYQRASWKTSKNGNLYLKTKDGFIATIYKKDNQLKAVISKGEQKKWSKVNYVTMADIKKACIRYISNWK